MKPRYAGFSIGIILPILLHYSVAYLDESGSEVLLGIAMIFHFIVSLPVLFLDPGVVSGITAILFWGIVGFLCGLYFEKRTRYHRDRPGT